MTTLSEAVNSLTGLDEVAISKHFYRDWGVLSAESPTMFARALVMVGKTRQGVAANEAKTAALALTIKELNTYFEPEPEEVDGDEPVSEPGKGS